MSAYDILAEAMASFLAIQTNEIQNTTIRTETMLEESAPGTKGTSKSAIEVSSQTVKNEVIDLERSGSGLKNDKVKPIYDNSGNIVKEYPAKPKAHGFPDIIDNYAGDAVKTKTPDGADLYQLEGSYNGVNGRFEWIVDNGKVTHRMFIENGSMNGVPIKP